MKAATIILIALALALGAAMLVQHNKAVEQKNADVAEKIDLTNRLEATRAKFEEQERIAMYLQTNLTVREQELLSTSNTLLKTSADLAKTQKEAQAAADAAKAEMAKRERRINDQQAMKGDEKLMAGAVTPAATSNFNLNVELKQDGGAIVVPKPNPPAPAPAK